MITSQKIFLLLTAPLFLFTSSSCQPNSKSTVLVLNDDSVCRLGKKVLMPIRQDIHFPAKEVSDNYKIRELHLAIPDSLNNEDNPNYWFYNYYFISKITDYDPKRDSVYSPAGDNLRYKLKDTYFLDFNGDGLLDFIHYPKYYMALMRDIDAYEIFLKQKNGTYKWLSFMGYIYEITFNKDSTLNNFKTFLPHCCDDNHETFNEYKFDKKEDSLVLISSEKILSCQLIKYSKQ